MTFDVLKPVRSNVEFITPALLNVWHIDLTFEVLYVFINALPFHIDESKKSDSYNLFVQITGCITSVITVLNAGAPGQKIIEVWKTGDYLKIPIYTSIAQIVCSVLWACYGFIEIQSRIMMVITKV